jgi:hypothetical protein
MEPDSVFGAPVIGQGRGLVRGATGGAAYGASSAARGFHGCGRSTAACGVFILLIPVLTIGGAVLGGIAGASAAVPEDKAKEINQSITKAMKASHPQLALRRYVFKSALEQGALNVKQIIDSGVSDKATANYRKLREHGVDTVLEVGIVRVGLYGGRGTNPALSVFVEAKWRLVSTKDGKEIYSRDQRTYVGATKRFSQWGANASNSLKEELAKAYRNIATNIVETVFFVAQ